MSDLLPLPVLLPLLGAALTLALRRHAMLQRTVAFTVLVAQVVTAVALMLVTHEQGPQALWLGAWDEPLGIVLVADRLSALMLLVSSAVCLLVLVYAIGQGVSDGDEDSPLAIYFPTYLVLSAGVSNAFLAGDLFNLFVSFEMLLFSSFVLLTLGGQGPRIRAGTTYVIVSVVSSMLFLVTIAAVYAATGTVNLAQLALRLPEIDGTVALALQLSLLIVFGIKAAIFPMSAWLPDSYPSAPAPVSAVFAGLLTKVGIYAILRTETLLFPGSDLGDLLMVLGLATMVTGILGAVAQSGIKRMLSFTLVSHIGFMLFGVGLGSEAGLSAAIFYIAHHITVQTALFLVSGLIERVGGSTVLDRLGGLASRSALLAVLFFVPAMNLAGIPPFSGFVAKTGLIQAGVADGGAVAWTLVAGSIVTSILTLYAVTKAWSAAFWRPAPQEQGEASVIPTGIIEPSLGRLSDAVGHGVLAAREAPVRPAEDEDGSDGRIPRLMLGATTAVVVLSVVLSLAGGPLFEYTDSAAWQMTSRGSYLEVVLPEEVR
ncbi:Na+/H+ antiporter subunit D [Janibacter alkaliphilus]|uniref:Multicomponent Na+:H+ antiporter subunit D n=1 Tax=Janibacter alkaliphilus TaxID=1069963 RepID=A0A852X2C1_9MICO|nr:Na+/H+ antiporter subunit D [Janibacter alkaliphilus]NYG37029.1 multicomponent Na+:H+ antiporter subunit D [Janibacter alkaliphilus]